MNAPAVESPPASIVIVNGDDFGRSAGINAGILECHDDGILTSASLMTLWPASAAAAAAAGTRPRLAIGLHVDLGEWIHTNGSWAPTYERVPLDDEHAVRAEVERQLRAFRRLLEREPTHLDSHQHVHRTAPVRTVLAEIAAELAIPLRHFCPAIRYCGEFFGQSNTGEKNLEALSVSALAGILRNLPRGTTELACHPGYAHDLATSYREERELEIQTLCDSRVRAAITTSALAVGSFADVRLAAPL
jgi:chitin disaccharide deacetylase